jgi:hypothetical protein
MNKNSKMSEEEFCDIILSAGVIIGLVIKHSKISEGDQVPISLMMNSIIFVEDYYREEKELELKDVKKVLSNIKYASDLMNEVYGDFIKEKENKTSLK